VIGIEIGNVCQIVLALGAILAAFYTWRNYRLNWLIKERDAYVELNKLAMDDEVSGFLKQDKVALFCHAFLSHNWMVYEASQWRHGRLVSRWTWENERKLLHMLARKPEFKGAVEQLVAGFSVAYNREIIKALDSGIKWRDEQNANRIKRL
jgi:hypothetical protein